MNHSEKLFNTCMNTPFGKSTFVKAVPTDGSEALTAKFIRSRSSLVFWRYSLYR